MRTGSRLSAPVCLPALLLLAGCSLMPAPPPEPVAAPSPPATAPAPPAITEARPEPAARPEPPRASTLAEPEVEAAIAPEPDLVARIRNGFALPPGNDADVAEELAWYADNADYIARVFERGQRYLHHIAEALDARGMPSDLALLPIIESAFDPFAYSRGRASGLWQIIPGTGERLGLRQNWWYDGRRDIVDSTRAALDYLEILHAQFDGDWLLAVAGYNSGPGNVTRAIRKAEAEGRPTDFWGIRRDLPAETVRYVPRLLAIRDLVADPDAFGIELAAIENAPYFAAIDTGSQIDLALAADLSGIGIDDLYALNPGINRWATDPEGPHRLLVPAVAADDFTTALAALDPRDRVRWTRHEIVRGETLSQIAAKYETTADALRQINEISGSLIRAGDYLMIPQASAESGAYSQSLQARNERQQNRERDGARVDYVVRSGDSLWSIAERYGVGTGELAVWNAMAPGDVLSVGRRLVVWTGSDGTEVPASAAGPAQIRQVNYIVRSGDSLSSIAGRFRVPVAKLLEWNGLSPERYLQPGQSLVLFVDVTAQSS